MLKSNLKRSLTVDEVKAFCLGKYDVVLDRDLDDADVYKRFIIQRGLIVLVMPNDEAIHGHYISITIGEMGLVSYFDSYGFRPEKLGSELLMRFLAVLKAQGYLLEINMKQMQKMDSAVSTCGRWCLTRVLERELGNYAFCEKMQGPLIVKDTDMLITLMTSLVDFARE